jgi:hypothetical protein
MATRHANSHAHDPLTHTLPDDDLYEIPDTAPRHHLSHQRSSSSTAFTTTTPCRPLHVARPNMVTHRLAGDGVLTIFTRSLRRPTIAHPEALARVASSGQAQLQIFDLALIPIVGICPQINHMKLNKHTWRQNIIAKGACRTRYFLNKTRDCISSFFFRYHCVTTRTHFCCIYTWSDRPLAWSRLVRILLQNRLKLEPSTIRNTPHVWVLQGLTCSYLIKYPN